MTSSERRYTLHKAILYLVRHNIAGSIVECGVWRGGSMMLAALTLIEAPTRPVISISSTHSLGW